MWQVCASRPAKRTLRFLGGVSLRVAIGSTTNADLALTTMTRLLLALALFGLVVTLLHGVWLMRTLLELLR